MYRAEDESSIHSMLTHTLEAVPARDTFRERLRGELLATVGPNAEAPCPTRDCSRSPWSSAAWRSVPWGAAAALLLALLVGVLSSNQTAFAEVQRAIERFRSVVVEATFPNQPGLNCKVYLLPTSAWRRVHSDGLAFVHDPGANLTLGVNPQDKTAWRIENATGPEAWTQLQRMLEWEENEIEPLGEETIEGKVLTRYRLRIGAGVRNDVSVWVDPETRLPARMEYTSGDAVAAMTARGKMHLAFSFNRAIDPGLFLASVPQGFRMVESGPLEPAPPAPVREGLTIVAGVGIGDARFGSSVEQSLALLGPPSELFYLYATDEGELWSGTMRPGESHTGVVLGYKPLGVSLTFDAQRGLSEILASKSEPGYRPFRGATSKGIALGASRREVESAHGAPSKVRGPYDDGTEALLYEQERLFFSLSDGRVDAIQCKHP